MSDLETLKSELSSSDWNYQRVMALVKRLNLVPQEELDAARDRLHLLQILTTALLTVPAGQLGPTEPTMQEELQALRHKLEVLEVRTAQTSESVSLLAAHAGRLVEGLSGMPPQADLLGAVAAAVAVAVQPLAERVGDSMEAEHVQLLVAQALTPVLHQVEALNERLHLLPTRAELASLAPLPEQNGPQAKPSQPRKPLRGAELAKVADGVRIEVSYDGVRHVATSPVTGEQTFWGMSPNAARSKCYAAVVSALQQGQAG